jgi:hypothetical protein
MIEITGAHGIFAMGEPRRIRDLVTGVGFAEPELEEIAFEFRYVEADDLWDSLIRLAGALARAVTALPGDEERATRAAITENVAAYPNEDGSYTFPAATWVARTR